MTLEVDMSGEDKTDIVEKILVRLDDAETQFNSQGACVVISQDRDCKHIITMFNKSLFTKEQTMQNIFSKGKSFFVHYPVFPPLMYKVPCTTNSQDETPKMEIMETQLWETFDDFTNNDYGAVYLGGGYKTMHFK